MNAVLERKGVEVKKQIRRMEIWLGDLGKGVGCEQDGIRPLLIISNDKGNEYGPVVMVAPLTSQAKAKMPTHVPFKADELGLMSDSIGLFEQIRTIDKSRLLYKVAEVPAYREREIDRVVNIAATNLFLK